MQVADLEISNLECTLFLLPRGNSLGHEGFLADPDTGAPALQAGCVLKYASLRYGAVLSPADGIVVVTPAQ